MLYNANSISFQRLMKYFEKWTTVQCPVYWNQDGDTTKLNCVESNARLRHSSNTRVCTGIKDWCSDYCQFQRNTSRLSSRHCKTSDGVHNISYDIIVHSTTHDQHDEHLGKVMNVVLPSTWKSVNSPCLWVNWHSWDMFYLVAGWALKAVADTRGPESASEVRSFLGLVNYSARFIPDLTMLTEPLRRLTKKGVEFQWGPSSGSSVPEPERQTERH